MRLVELAPDAVFEIELLEEGIESDKQPQEKQYGSRTIPVKAASTKEAEE